jgi:hypothetical protein
MGEAMSDEIRAEIKAAATALCHYPSGPHAANSCCSGIGRCEMKAAVAEITRLRAELAICALSDTPPGMVLVPREPTPEMIQAVGRPLQGHTMIPLVAARIAWDTMVKAAGKGKP